MMRRRPRSILLSPHAQQFFASCLIIALGQACTTAEVATPEGPSDKGIISDNRPSASEAQSTTGQTSGMFTPDNPTVQTPTNNPGPVEQPNNQQPQQDQETTPTPQTPAVPNPEPPTHSNAPPKAKVIPVKMVNLIGAASPTRVRWCGFTMEQGYGRNTNGR